MKKDPLVKWHITLLFQIKFFLFCAYFWLKLSMKFHSKDTSLKNMTHNTSIPNQNFTNLCLLSAEISMKFHSKIPPWEIRLVTLQFNITFHEFLLIMLKLSMKFHSKDTSLRDMKHNTSIPNQIFSILCLFFAEIRMKFQWKKTLLWNDT